jgi:predicted acetyltransferase
VVAQKFEVGSKVEISDGGLVFAELNPSNYKHYGKYDYTQNLQNMITAVNNIRDPNPNPNLNNNTNNLESHDNDVNIDNKT